MKINRTLAVIALVLLVLSIWAYRSSINRGERFERGQTFLANLNPDEIAAIKVTSGDEAVALKRGEDQFTVTTIHGYPAKNESVNRLIKNLIEITLEKRVGSGEELNSDLALVEGGDGTTEVMLENEAGKPMVHFLVGRTSEGTTGSYVRRVVAEGEESIIFLSSRQLYLNSDPASYLDKELLDVKDSEIATITGPDFKVSEQDGALELEEVGSGWEENTSNMSKIKGVLSFLSFDEVFLGDDEQVAGLSFSPRLRIDLKDTSGYTLALAERGEDTYLKISGFHPVDRVMVERDETDEELQEKRDLLARANEINGFNNFHGSWVYKLNTSTADKIKLTRSDLIEQKE
jgi:hypothetical protein